MLLILASSLLRLGDPPAPKLTMSAGVPCANVRGYRDYDPLEPAVLTKDDKLLVYYEPSGFTSKKVGDAYQVHLVQDGRIRRRGQKAVLLSKQKLLDYKGSNPSPPERIYLANTIALRTLAPGEYDLDIILRDELTKDDAVSQVVEFRVKPSPPAKP